MHLSAVVRTLLFLTPPPSLSHPPHPLTPSHPLSPPSLPSLSSALLMVAYGLASLPVKDNVSYEALQDRRLVQGVYCSKGSQHAAVCLHDSRESVKRCLLTCSIGNLRCNLTQHAAWTHERFCVLQGPRKVIKQFQEDPETTVFLLTRGQGAAGLTLTQGDTPLPRILGPAGMQADTSNSFLHERSCR